MTNYISVHTNGQWTFFTFPGFSAAEVIIVGLTWRAVNGRVPQICFAFPFAQIAKEKLHNSVFMTFNTRTFFLERLIRQSEERTMSNLPSLS